MNTMENNYEILDNGYHENYYQIQCLELDRDKENLITIFHRLLELCIDKGLINDDIKDIHNLQEICKYLGLEPTTSVIGFGMTEDQIKSYYTKN